MSRAMRRASSSNAHHLVAHGKALAHRAREFRALVHRADDVALACIHAGPVDAAQRGVRHLDLALHHQRHPVGEGHGGGAPERAGQPVHEARTVIARPLQGLPQFDAVLRLEVAARRVMRAGKGHEGDLAPLPQRMQAVAQGRVQAPIGVECEGRRGAAAGAWHGDGGPGLVVKAAAHGHQQVGGVVAAPQEHQQETRLFRADGPELPAAQAQARAGQALQHLSSVHERSS